MKIENYQFPKSSFLSVNKDLNLIVNKILSNDRLQKLLYYTNSNPLASPALTEDQKIELLQNNIKLIPKLYIDGSVLNYIIISLDHFIENQTNPEFRDNIIRFEILCHFDQWNLKDFNLRPYRIAGEIDSFLNGAKLTGIGKLTFLQCEQMFGGNDFAGLKLEYAAIHGEEDKKGMLNPVENAEFIKDFDRMYNE